MYSCNVVCDLLEYTHHHQWLPPFIPPPSLQLISYLWCSTPHNTLWESDSGVLHLALAIVHLACWISISCSVFTIDYLELLGIKQVNGA